MIEDCGDDSALEKELREEGLETTRKEIGWIAFLESCNSLSVPSI